jgi:hypothetical protein
MSLAMMYALVIAYVIIMIACACERKWTDFMYWGGAAVITLSLILRRV